MQRAAWLAIGAVCGALFAGAVCRWPLSTWWAHRAGHGIGRWAAPTGRAAALSVGVALVLLRAAVGIGSAGPQRQRSHGPRKRRARGLVLSISAARRWHATGGARAAPPEPAGSRLRVAAALPVDLRRRTCSASSAARAGVEGRLRVRRLPGPQRHRLHAAAPASWSGSAQTARRSPRSRSCAAGSRN